MISGMTGGMRPGRDLVLQYLNSEFQDGDTNVMSVPAFARRGDLLFFMDMDMDSSAGSGSGELEVPSGFTAVASVGGENSRIALSAKILDGTETTLTGMDFYGDDSAVACHVFRANRPLRGFEVHNPAGSINDTNPSGISISGTGVARRPALALGHMQCVGGPDGISSGSISPSMTAVSSTSGRRLLHYSLFQSGPLSDFSYDMGDEGDINGLLGAYISVW